MARKALVIKVDEYDDETFAPLPGADRDARKIDGFLSQALPQGSRFDVEVMRNPTSGEVGAKLNAIAKTIDANSIFALFFIGHGLGYGDGQLLLCREADDSVLSGAQFGAITTHYLNNRLEKARGDVFFCFDTCRVQPRRDRSGETYVASGVRGLLRDVTSYKPKKGQASGAGRRWALSSCGDGQSASDDGTFMTALTDAMETMLREDGRIELGDRLVGAISSRMTGNQRPESRGLPFVLARGESEPRRPEGAPEVVVRSSHGNKALFWTAAILLAVALLFLVWSVLNSRGLSAEFQKLVAENLALKKDVETLTSGNETLKRDAAALTDDKAKLSGRLAEQEKEVGRLSTKVDSLTKENSSLKDENQKLASSEKTLSDGVDALTKDKTSLQTEVADLEKQVDDLKSQLAWAISTARVGGVRKTLTIEGVEYAFRWIPAGSFTMGSSKKEQEAALANTKRNARNVDWDYYDEVQHKVNFSRGFWMLETEITQEMWESLMGENPSRFKGSKRLPVEQISWEDCQKFVSKLNELGVSPEGFKFSLPTESEWEYACRSGTTSAYSFGDALNGDKANCDGTYPFGTDKKGADLKETKEVGKYGANKWGLYDMHGNVSEWTSDLYGAYPMGEVEDPTGPEEGLERVIRGGGWCDGAVYCRAAGRVKRDPVSRNNYVGARLVLRSLD